MCSVRHLYAHIFKISVVAFAYPFCLTMTENKVQTGGRASINVYNDAIRTLELILRCYKHMTCTPVWRTFHIYTVWKIFRVVQNTFPYTYTFLNTNAESFALISTYSARTHSPAAAQGRLWWCEPAGATLQMFSPPVFMFLIDVMKW